MRITSRVLLALAFSCGPVFCQAVSFGVTGGLPTLDRALPSDESRPYIVGPMVEFRLPHGFAIEVDALYQRVGNSFAGGFGSAITAGPGTSTGAGISGGSGVSGSQFLNFFDRARGNDWQFPVLGKYYLHTRLPWQPFLGAGFAAQWVSQTTTGTQSDNLNGPVQTSVFTFHDWRTSLGFTSVAGIRLRTGRLQWEPQFRYSRFARFEPLVQHNQADLVLGIRF